MKRYDPISVCSEADMREHNNGDYVSYEDAARTYDALLDMVIEFGFFAEGYSNDHPIQIALSNAKDVIFDFQGFTKKSKKPEGE